jgi:heptosyltransferase-2
VSTRELPFDQKKVNRLLVRAVNWLGDAVMTTPAIGALRTFFPDARITLLATPLVAELFSPHEWVDEIVIYEKNGRHSGLRGRLRLAAELRSGKFDMAILLQNAIDAALIAWLAGIPIRMGYRTDGRALLLTHGCPVDEKARKLHHVDYYLRMLVHFGINGESRALSLTVTMEEEREAAAILREAGIEEGDFILGINPGATYGSAKRWYPDRFAAVADELSARWDCQVIVIGGADEREIADEICASAMVKCLNLAGRTSVRQLMAVIKRCDFFITNDSGPMHMAAAFGVPLVAVFGPTDRTTTSPYSEKAVVVSSDAECAPCLLRQCPTDHRCMVGVSADEVVEAACRLREATSSDG